jgi:hypothetical protein
VRSTGAKRGRPLKFGRPTRPLSISLPHDVIEWLETLDPDPAWAIVGLFEKVRSRQPGTAPRASAELVQLPGKRALILVAPDVFDGLQGVSVIRLSDGRGFLALQAGKGYADLELAVVDQIDAQGVTPERRRALTEIRKMLRDWRQSGLVFESRSILVVERQEVGEKARTLSGLASA